MMYEKPSPGEDRVLAALVAAWWGNRTILYEEAVFEVFFRLLRRKLRSRPRIWFANGEREEDSIRSMTAEVFNRCASLPFTRSPYRLDDSATRGSPAGKGRIPFVAFLEDAFDDRAIRFWSVDSRLSVAGEYLEEVRRKNRAQLGWLAWPDLIYDRLGPALNDLAVPIGSGRWAVAEQGRWAVRAWADQVVAARRVVARCGNVAPGGLDAWIRELVPALLAATGPLRRSDMAHLIAEVAPVPADGLESLVSATSEPATGAVDRELRALAVRCWSRLDADERLLVRGILHGWDTVRILEHAPELGSEAEVSRAVKAVAEQLLTPLLELAESKSPAGETPRARLARIADLLGELIPELEAA